MDCHPYCWIVQESHCCPASSMLLLCRHSGSGSTVSRHALFAAATQQSCQQVYNCFHASSHIAWQCMQPCKLSATFSHDYHAACTLMGKACIWDCHNSLPASLHQSTETVQPLIHDSTRHRRMSDALSYKQALCSALLPSTSCRHAS